MENVVVFAGAGASAASGYASSAHLLHEVLRRLTDERFEAAALSGAQAELLDRCRKLLPGLAGDFGEIDFADIVSILDHCIAQGEALGPELKPEDLRHMRRLLDFAIAEVLAAPLPGHPAPVDPARFAQVLLDRVHRREGELTIVSPNYDVSLDMALFRELERRGVDPRQAVDLGFTRRDELSGRLVPQPPGPALRLLKLHGALNWLRCSRCGTCSVDFGGPVAQHAGTEGGSRDSCACGHSPQDMLLVAPSLVRDVRDVNLLSIWQAAVEALRASATWIFIGFSLRSEDLAIRSMLARARLGSVDLPRRIVVVGKDDEAPPVFQLFLGEIEYRSGGLERFLDEQSR
jgi:hypothetical protein